MIQRISGLHVWLLSACALLVTGETGQFYGGTISSVAVANGNNGDWDVRLDLVTAWALGRGPCGTGCSKSSVGMDTEYTRPEVLKNTSSEYLGNLTSEVKYNRSSSVVTSVDLHSRSYMYERVLAVDEHAMWEQERLEVTTSMKTDVTYMYNAYLFDGRYWRNLSLPAQHGHSAVGNIWHLPLKLEFSGIRSDLNKPNSSPQTLTKPVYRLPLNRDNKIALAVTDPDGDYVHCSGSLFFEGGFLGTHVLPNLTVSKDCVVTIPTYESLGYRNDSWGAVSVTLRDYNKHVINVGADTVHSGTLSLSYTVATFLVHTVSDFEEPVFVSPSPEHLRKFTVDQGATWKTTACAKAVNQSVLSGFTVVGRQQEPLNFVYHSKDPQGRAGITCTTVTWAPAVLDVMADHIVCISAVDQKRSAGSPERCYTIAVKAPNQTTDTGNTQAPPFFFIFPEQRTVMCEVNETCIVPVYMRLPITDYSVKVTMRTVDTFQNDGPLSRALDKCADCYRTDLMVASSTAGHFNNCLAIVDLFSGRRTFDELCLDVRVEDVDPCSSLPCANSGDCSRSLSDPSDFQCACLSSHFYGKDCRKEVNNCDSSPCLQGTCYNMRGPTYFCRCFGGWIGKHCDVNIDDCRPDPCGAHAQCVDGVNSHTCSCYPRYHGTRCQNDRCPGQPASVTSCFIGASANTTTTPTAVKTRQYAVNTTAATQPGRSNVPFSVPKVNGYNVTASTTPETTTTPTSSRLPARTTTPAIATTAPVSAAPLCFSCTDLSHASLCDNVKRCQKDEVCYLERYSVSEGNVRFQSGCQAKTACKASSTTAGCYLCCDGDVCNHHGCGDTGLPPAGTRGPLCFDCSHASSPDECHRVSLCKSGQVCGVTQFEWGDVYQYHIGCHDSRCRNIGDGLSRRTVTTCQRCCDGDLCNDHCSATGTQPVPGVAIIG